MRKYIFKRLGLMIVTAFAIMTVLFILIRLLPNNVHAVLGGNQAQLEAMREALYAKDSNDWLGYNRWVDSNIKRTII